MDNCRARLVVLLLGDPHLLEGAQRRQDGASNPHRVLALRWCDNLDLHCGWSKRCQLLRHTLSNALEHRSTSRKDDVCVEVFTDIHITLHDRLECGVMDTTGLLPNEAWLEENFRAAEALVTNSDDVTVWKLVGLLLVRAFRSGLHFRIEIQG